MRFKASYYWEHLWETHWEPREHIKNLKGTYFGNKEKRIKALSVHDEPSHWVWGRVFFFSFEGTLH
jgi:hypothetical protein